MGRIWMSGGAGGFDGDLVTALAGDILSGKVTVGPDGEPVAGTLALTGTAADSQVLSGQTYYNTDAKTQRTGSMANRGAVAAALDCGGSYTIPAGYHNGAGEVTANSLASQTPANAAAGDILSGRTAWVNGGEVTGSMPSRGAATIMPGKSDQTIAAGQYLSGAQTIKGDGNLVPGNIVSGKSVFGVAGSARVLQTRGGSLTPNGGTTSLVVSGGGSRTFWLCRIGAVSFNPLYAIIFTESGGTWCFSPQGNGNFTFNSICSGSQRGYYAAGSNGGAGKISMTKSSVVLPVPMSGTCWYTIIGY